MALIGTRLKHYEIVEQLGAGGMGRVYAANDLRLGRKVALKVLHSVNAADGDRRARFDREARAVAALNHPNIVTLHSIEDADGVQFLTMELVEGRTLAQSIPEGGLEPERLLGLAIPLAEAISAAHERGITHRDLKPGNIMIAADGRPKILDFGLAKLCDAPGGGTGSDLTASLTGEGRLVGTLHYMSPEQAKGMPADHRCDIFAFGAVLYEMAVGHRPFGGETPVDIISSILKDVPHPIMRIRAGFPRDLERIVGRCLEKDPRRRFQTALDLANELRELRRETGREPSVAAAPPELTSIAVLPLANLSGDPEQEYFIDGMTEALITNLAKVGALKVISRTTAMRYKDTRKPLREVARELGVGSIVEGSVQRAGERVRITAQLIDADKDRHLWAESYDRELKDVLSLQSEVARAIAEEVRGTLTPEEAARLACCDSVDPEAYQAYLKGRFLWNKRRGESVQRAIVWFEQAIERDPTYPLGHVGLADSYNILGFYGVLAPKLAFPRAKAAARRALELDADLAEAHTSLAYAVMYNDWSWADAEAGLQRAMELDPGYAPAHQFYGNYLVVTGDTTGGLAEFQRGADLDPLSMIITAGIGWTLYYARRYEEAATQLRKTLDLDDGFIVAHFWLGQVLEQLGRPDAAVAHFEKAVALSPAIRTHRAAVAHAHALAGRTAEARAIVEELEALAREHYVPAYDFAEIHAALGDKERALDWLERAFDQRCRALTHLAVEPRLDGLREEPRFRELLGRLGLPQHRQGQEGAAASP